MKRKRYLSYVIVPEGGGRTLRGRISYPALRILLVSLFSLFLLLIIFAFQYGKVSFHAMMGRRAEKRVRILEDELRKMDDLEREVIKLKEVKEQIEGMLGVIHDPRPSNQMNKKSSLPSIWPVKGKVTWEFAEKHQGMDIAVPEGSSVWATADGIVIFSGWDVELGYMVEIDHGDGLSTIYGHNSEVLVEKGSRVKRGDLISFSGSSGHSTAPHLHYEVIKDGMRVNPRRYLK